jgi:integrase
MARTIKRANANLEKRDQTPLPEGLTPHSLRRTFISLLLAIGEEVPYESGRSWTRTRDLFLIREAL